MRKEALVMDLHKIIVINSQFNNYQKNQITTLYKNTTITEGEGAPDVELSSKILDKILIFILIRT